jgi:hypothetical protein
MTPELESVPDKLWEESKAAVNSYALGTSKHWKSVYWSLSFSSVQDVFGLRAFPESYNRNSIEDSINSLRDYVRVAVSDLGCAWVPVWDA